MVNCIVFSSDLGNGVVFWLIKWVVKLIWAWKPLKGFFLLYLVIFIIKSWTATFMCDLMMTFFSLHKLSTSYIKKVEKINVYTVDIQLLHSCLLIPGFIQFTMKYLKALCLVWSCFSASWQSGLIVRKGCYSIIFHCRQCTSLLL